MDIFSPSLTAPLEKPPANGGGVVAATKCAGLSQKQRGSAAAPPPTRVRRKGLSRQACRQDTTVEKILHFGRVTKYLCTVDHLEPNLSL